ncbi:hypothetical protein ITQ85_01735 [Pediococcus pentosaceus]|uniref:hypothetical protein n=1 Tax=Pediococcus pentosaceus TaxID=1255 RepID=UPI0018FEFAD7|nr:hypothetical protein [Pediococcus pentosaceus]MBF7112626.1 hypothetical protein [Pediococcus pentosaceus]
MSKNRKSSRIPKNKTEIFKQFQEQLDFLKNAADLYDNGNWSAIKMASVPLRTLFYKQKYGPVLIDRIKEVNKDLFFSSVKIPNNVIIYQGPIAPIKYMHPLNKTIDTIYIPKLSSGVEFHKVGFSNWIDGRIFISNGESFTRQELIKFVANQDGGGHVDAALTEKYHQMVHNFYSVQTYPGNTKVEYIHLALLRQIVHEALYSFKKMHLLHFKYETNDVSKSFEKNNVMFFQVSDIAMSTGKVQREFSYY